MKCTESKVTKLLITDVKGLDPLTVFLENYEPGKGKLTLEIYGESYSAYWGGMGGGTLEQFILDSDNHYLSKNLAGLKDLSEPDYDSFAIEVKKQIIENRRIHIYSEKKARELWDNLDNLDLSKEFFDDSYNHQKIHEIAGGEWWDLIPSKDSTLYKYLCKILDALKACLSERAGILKPYQVGENDIVLAHSEQSAKQFLFNFCAGLDIEDLKEVEDLSNRLDMAFFNEDGTFLCTLKTLIEKNQEPGECYLTGWE